MLTNEVVMEKQVAATVNTGYPVKTLNFNGANEIVARFKAYATAIIVLTYNPTFRDENCTLKNQLAGYKRRSARIRLI